jgi:asparagine synthase (glutamine-hydrolysing)
MCGLLGWVGLSVDTPDPSELGAALDLIRHRGPDAGCAWIGDGIALGHRRLAVIDLAQRADQPLRMDPLILIFNGEIYNYRSLRQELESMGHRFVTSSDTEVLLKAWMHWGRDALSRLEGMFAFAIWDLRSRNLTLARDRFGEKPLFVHQRTDGLAFSSELPPLVRLTHGKLVEDSQALGLYFLYSYIPAPQSIFRGVSQLEPGTWLEWNELDGLKQGRYYDLRKTLKMPPLYLIPSYAEAVIQLRTRLTHAVRLRVESADVPVATLLSGGIDSSIITALASNVSPRSISAYTLGFPQDPEFDETESAQHVARSLSNVRHHVVQVNEATVLDFAPQVLDRLGEPFADASILPTSLLCSQVDEKVALGGDAADELFAGYGVYPAIVRGASLPAWFRKLLLKLPGHTNPTSISHPFFRALVLFHRNLGSDALASYLKWRTYSNPTELKSLGLDISGVYGVAQRLAADVTNKLADIQATDIEFNLPYDMLKKVDYAAMAHGVEVRLPFLDSELVHWALRLPDEYRLKGNRRKRILRDAFANVIPQEVLRRRKMGFLLPIRTWLRHGRLHHELRAMLVSQTQFDVARVLELLLEHSQQKADHSVLLWAIYIYLRWKERLKYWANYSYDATFEVKQQVDGSVVVQYQ